MEIKFNSKPIRLLHTLHSQTVQREETQEVRLSDGMPDIGRILGCWGQTIIRNKDWRSGGMGAGGGVMAWILYAPEDGTEPRAVDAWIPFQQKWDFEDHGRDGYVLLAPGLQSIDARSISPRKIMLRCAVSVWGKALQSGEENLYRPEGMPEDIQLLQRAYPMELPQEFGEKLFQVEETVTPKDSQPAAEQILRYQFTPRITEQKVMSTRLVFRGFGRLYLLYQSGGRIYSQEAQFPFSQYADLDRDYSSAATARIYPIVTNLELEHIEGQLQLKASIAAQFVVYDRQMVELVEDAYSLRRSVQMEKKNLELPMRLDQLTQDVPINQNIELDTASVTDISCLAEHPTVRQTEDGAAIRIAGTTQLLYEDQNGQIQGHMARFEQNFPITSDPNNRVEGSLTQLSRPQVSLGGEGLQIHQEMQLDAEVFGNSGLEMVTAIELGELQEPDQDRPSVILRRCEDCDLWELAKKSGSTVEAIRKANHLNEAPENGTMLLIPVL